MRKGTSCIGKYSLVSGLQAREARRPRRAQIIAPGLGELQKLLRHLNSNICNLNILTQTANNRSCNSSGHFVCATSVEHLLHKIYVSVVCAQMNECLQHSQLMGLPQAPERTRRARQHRWK